MRKILSTLLVLLILCSCSTTNTNPVVDESEQIVEDTQEEVQQEPEEEKFFIETGVKEDDRFDGIFLTISIEDFIKQGFSFGDSINIYFSNGVSAIDIPFYSGFYVKRGLPLVVGYEGYEYIEVTRNNIGLWTAANMTEDVTAKVELNEVGKYLLQEQTFSLSYSDDIKDYASEEEFSNYRMIRGGKLKDNLLFRGASTVDKNRNRPTTVNKLIKRDKINYVLNLAENKDTYKKLIKKGLSSSYVNKLYKKKKVILLGMSADYTSREYGLSVIEGFKGMLENEGPYYIHCLEGKDRTGFVCLLLECLASFDYEEMLDDYMMTYANYYGITKEKEPERYEAIKTLYFDSFIDYLHPEGSSTNYKEDACNYLRSFGMQEEDIQALISLLTE